MDMIEKMPNGTGNAPAEKAGSVRMPSALFSALGDRPDACLAFFASPPDRQAAWCRLAVGMTQKEAEAFADAIGRSVPALH